MPFTLLRALGPRVLVSFDPDQKTGPRYWAWDGVNDMATLDWVRAENAVRNIYVHVNAFDHEGTPRRAKKADVKSARHLHVDIDARAGDDLASELARIRALLEGYRPPPSFVVMSGGGYNAYWALDEEVADPEPYNRKIASDLGGDACWNADRVLRLPGTVNWPNARKRGRGRGATQAVLEVARGGSYPAGEFGKLGGGDGKAEAELAGVAPRVADMDDPRLKNVPDWAKCLIVQGDNADKPYGSRSEALFSAVCAMVRGGVGDADIYAVITDPGFGISAHVLAQGGGADRAARRAIERGREAVGAEADFERSAVEPFPVLKDSYKNVSVAMRGLGACLSFDEFACRVVAEGMGGGWDGELTEDAAVELHSRVQGRWGFTPPIDFWFRALRRVAHERRFHPVRDYLAGLKWDGVPRLDTWLVDVCGAEDSEYTRAVGALSLVACVRRVRAPGCKHDAMLVIESEKQGVGKSTLLRRLAVRDEWFADKAPLDGDPRELMEAVAGKWIVEVAELRGVKDARSGEAVKAALSRQVDVARMSYRREPESRPRQCVFFGSTNDVGGYLHDDTGNRRFWPVRVQDEEFSLKGLEVDQLWAEAVVREARGEGLELPREAREEAGRQQGLRLASHPWEEVLACLEEVEGWLTLKQVLDALGVPVDRRGTRTDRELAKVLKKLGYSCQRPRVGGRKVRVWKRGEGAELGAIELFSVETTPGVVRVSARLRGGDPGDL